MDLHQIFGRFFWLQPFDGFVLETSSFVGRHSVESTTSCLVSGIEQKVRNAKDLIVLSVMGLVTEAGGLSAIERV